MENDDECQIFANDRERLIDPAVHAVEAFVIKTGRPLRVYVGCGEILRFIPGI